MVTKFTCDISSAPDHGHPPLRAEPSTRHRLPQCRCGALHFRLSSGRPTFGRQPDCFLSCTSRPSPQKPPGGAPARCQPEPAVSGASLWSACAVQRPRLERQAAGWRTPWLEERRHSSVAMGAGVLMDGHRGRDRTGRYQRERQVAASGTAKVIGSDKLVNAIETDRFVICCTHASRGSKPGAVGSSANQPPW
jgi:hypothetical protein